MVLEAVYEQSFLDCSYGFRPGRSAHQALRVVRDQTMKMAGKWVLEIDVRKFFDSLDHSHLREIVRKRVRDGVLLRLIGKWLKAGVMEDGRIAYPEAGSPQGGSISPVLSNIYLHEVLDEWFTGQVMPRLVGRAVLIRYCDDAIIIFERERDAQRVLDVLPKRLAKYGLTLHPEKTRLVDFRQPDTRDASPEGGDARTRPGSFDLLGFTHYWAKSRTGHWVVKQKTARDRFQRALKRIADWCRRQRHEPVREQWFAVRRKLLGHYGYFGLIGNSPALYNFRHRVVCAWRKWLSRRSQRAYISWDRMGSLLRHYPLPQPRLRSASVT
jgi:group II intron reverse transcriptase/maturase